MEGVTLADQLVPELLIVFDNTVVNADDQPVICAVRVRVALRGLSMSRPAGVPDAAVPGQAQTVIGLFRQDLETSLCFDDDRLRFAVPHREPRGIIPAVFQLRQPFQKDGRRLSVSNISDYSTHIFTSVFNLCIIPLLLLCFLIDSILFYVS